MAGLFPSITNSQNVDRNGAPLAGSILTVYSGGTLALANCFQDIGLAITGPNPMQADETGRLPIFYVADGVYRVRLIDVNGVVIYDYPQIASIGASSSGGGGTSVDPTTVFSTGDELWKKIGGARTGWVRQNGRTIGSATSGASERANADTNALYLYIWLNYPDAKCPVISGRGGSAAADFSANKPITVPDMRGKGAFGLDGMGNGRANVIPDANVAGGDTADTDAARVGATTHALAQANLPSVNFVVDIPAGQGDHPHAFDHPAVRADVAGGVAGFGGGLGTIASTSHASLPGMSGTAASGGANAPLETISPGALGTWYIKL